jgi:serine protease AprX
VWEHIVGTWDGATLRLYRNGTEIGSKPFTGPLGSPRGDFEIANYDGIQHYLGGTVDEVALYNRALTASEIGTQYLGCQNIPAATNPSFVPTLSEVDSTLRINVTAANGSGSNSAASAPTAQVLAAPPPPPAPVVPTNTSPPTITGTPQDGGTLTATTGTWTGAPTDYSYRWRRCDAAGLACVDVAGQIGATYALTPADVGSTVVVAVTAAGASGEAASPATPVVAPAPPTSVSPPSPAAAPAEGVAVTTTPGTWNGTPPFTYSYQWQSCDAAGLACTDLAGATAAAFVPVYANVAHTLRVVVTARNSAGVSSAPSTTSGPVAMGTGYSSAQLWPYESGVAGFWPKAAAGELQPPTIAIVDSGIDATRTDFGGRVIQQVTLTSLIPNSQGDGYGHGTFVASIAAGQAHAHTGAAPNAKLVSLDVMDDNGMATVSDVIAAADWIYQNKDANNIRVANFSLTGTVASSVRYDPLDKAVEKLWLSGVVVVAAAGNYAQSGAESGVLYAPANDPFVITVGAQDLEGTLTSADDVTAPWSAWGYTPDGFAKPELSAPGRYMVGAVPPTSTLAIQRPAQIVEPGYMQLSGTSFAAPVVSGTAADLLAAHPTWTPDQVKGALMVAAQPLPLAAPRSSGVGAEDAAKALAATDPPNPNLGLDQYLIPDPSGSPIPVFDTAAWGQAASANAAWGQAAWGQAAWGQAAWGQAAWGQTYWSSAAWGQTSIAAPMSNAESDVLSGGGYWISAADLADARAKLGLG